MNHEIPHSIGDLTYKRKRLDNDNLRETWRWNCMLHSVDDHPAEIFTDSNKHIASSAWYTQGVRHRDSWRGPAFICDHYSRYFSVGLTHRSDGPAIIYASGTEYWYLHDNYMSFDNWLDKVDIPNENKVMMKLTHG
jgi:hypothetical protein